MTWPASPTSRPWPPLLPTLSSTPGATDDDILAWDTGTNLWTAHTRVAWLSADAPGAAEALGLGITDSPTWANGTFTGDLVIQGDLAVQGTTTTVDSETILKKANYDFLNMGYTVAAGQSAGKVVNFFPSGTQETVASYGVFTAGVDTVSDPQVTTDTGAVFAANDIVMLSGFENNDGFYEVVSHAAGAGGALVFRSTSFGITNQVEDWSLNQVTAGTDTGGTIDKVGVSVLRAGSADGLWEAGVPADVTPIVYSDVLLASGIGVTLQAYDADLDAVAALAGTGFSVRTAADTWAQRSIGFSGNGITVGNGDGVGGSPSISLTGIMEDIAAVTAPAGANEFLVSTGAGAFAMEDAPTARASMGAGTMDDVVDDTTPQLGGPLDTNGKGIYASAQKPTVAANITINIDDGNYVHFTTDTDYGASNPLTSACDILVTDPGTGNFGAIHFLIEGRSAGATDPTWDGTMTIFWGSAGAPSTPTTDGDFLLVTLERWGVNKWVGSYSSLTA